MRTCRACGRNLAFAVRHCRACGYGAGVLANGERQDDGGGGAATPQPGPARPSPGGPNGALGDLSEASTQATVVGQVALGFLQEEAARQAVALQTAAAEAPPGKPAPTGTAQADRPAPAGGELATGDVRRTAFGMPALPMPQPTGAAGAVAGRAAQAGPAGAGELVAGLDPAAQQPGQPLPAQGTPQARPGVRRTLFGAPAMRLDQLPALHRPAVARNEAGTSAANGRPAPLASASEALTLPRVGSAPVLAATPEIRPTPGAADSLANRAREASITVVGHPVLTLPMPGSEGVTGRDHVRPAPARPSASDTLIGVPAILPGATAGTGRADGALGGDGGRDPLASEAGTLIGIPAVLPSATSSEPASAHTPPAPASAGSGTLIGVPAVGPSGPAVSAPDVLGTAPGSTRIGLPIVAGPGTDARENQGPAALPSGATLIGAPIVAAAAAIEGQGHVAATVPPSGGTLLGAPLVAAASAAEARSRAATVMLPPGVVAGAAPAAQTMLHIAEPPAPPTLPEYPCDLDAVDPPEAPRQLLATMGYALKSRGLAARIRACLEVAERRCQILEAAERELCVGLGRAAFRSGSDRIAGDGVAAMLTAFDDQIRSAHAERVAVETRVARLEAELQQLEPELERAMAAARGEHELAEATRTDLARRVEPQEQALGLARGEVQSHRAALDATAAAPAGEATDARRLALQAELARAEQRLAALAPPLADLKQQLAAQEQLSADARRRWAQFEAQRAALRQRFADAEADRLARKGPLDARVTTLEDQMDEPLFRLGVAARDARPQIPGLAGWFDAASELSLRIAAEADLRAGYVARGAALDGAAVRRGYWVLGATVALVVGAVATAAVLLV